VTLEEWIIIYWGKVLTEKAIKDLRKALEREDEDE
jgi:hypothetical protein